MCGLIPSLFFLLLFGVALKLFFFSFFLFFCLRLLFLESLSTTSSYLGERFVQVHQVLGERERAAAAAAAAAS